MTRKLEELFGFDQLEDSEQTPSVSETLTPEQTHTAIVEIDATIDKIDHALPAVRDLATSDIELDDIARLAKESYENLSDLGMNVDSRFSAELFAVANNMLNTALTAKTTKLNKKLKMIELQLKKLKLDQDQAKLQKDEPELPTAEGQILSRNDLLERLIASRNENSN